MRRTRWLLAGLLALAAVGGGIVVAAGADDATPTAEGSPVSTAAVTRGDLFSVVSLNGTLTYRARPDGSPHAAINRARGVYTQLPRPGERVRCGDVLHRVDDEPVLLLCGAVPAYRDLRAGDEGRDVRQLNRNLRALGYRADRRDDDFTATTGAALRKLQADRGAVVDGRLGVEDAVVLPGPGRVSAVTGSLGGSARPGARVAQLTSNTLEVRVDLAASQQSEVRAGARAQVVLPGNTPVKGTVARVGRVAHTRGLDDDPATATVPASIRLAAPRRTRGLDRAPVRVEVTTKGVEDVLSVPVTALVGKAGGGFAVEAVRDGGRRELVAVSLGLFDASGGRVEVDGDVREGDRVVVPAS